MAPHQCPGCGADEVEAYTSRTVYACGTSSHDDRDASWSGPCAEMNCCEHGDHPAPPGKRFCSLSCAKCERTECDESLDCAGRCHEVRA